MKVILLQDYRAIGRKYDVKEISDGFARNFLFPNKIAKPATQSAIHEIENLKKESAKKEEELKKHLAELARKINGMALEFTVKADEHGSVFGSVTKEMILKAMRENKFVTKEHPEIKLTKPIKELGEHKVFVDLKKGIEAELKIIVRQSK